MATGSIPYPTHHQILPSGYRMSYVQEGQPDRPALLLLHGLPSNKRIWHSTIAHLADDFFCIAPDLLGLGESEKTPSASYTIVAHAEAVLALMDSLGIDTFAVLGHSMGSQIAMLIAARLAPARVTRLVSVDGVISANLQPLAAWLLTPAAILAAVIPGVFALGRMLARLAVARRLVAWFWFHDTRHLPEAVWAEQVATALQPGQASPILRSLSSLRSTSLLPMLPRIKAPTLVIFGQDEHLLPVNDTRYCEQLIPNCQVTIIDRCGHFPMLEQPARYFDALDTFLRD